VFVAQAWPESRGRRGWGDQWFDVRPFFGARPINVGDRERRLSVLAGGALVALALKRRTPASGLAAVVGGFLLYRGATGHCPAYRVADRTRSFDRRKGTGRIADEGSDTRRELGGRRGIHVDASIAVERPVEEVYRFWRDFENLPRFMRHLVMVSTREAGVSHWVARGPAGFPVEWDARIINDIPNKVIGWQSLAGSSISTAGSVNFNETAGGTTVHVRFQYEPPAGRLGAAVAALFGEEPNQTVREDLERLKSALENREMPTTT
jgi:uncharacterized membrane protein